MNKFTSLSAAFAFLAFFATANAAVVSSDANQNMVTLDLTDDITQESITMDALVQLPDGSTTRTRRRPTATCRRPSRGTPSSSSPSPTVPD